MNLVDHHCTLIVGVDTHFTTAPPYNPLHPFIGITFDVMDYLPFIGASTWVNNKPRGVSDTSGVLLCGEHIPLVGSFVAQAMIAHESVNFFGSLHTYAEGRRLSATTFQNMTCNDIGIPLSLRAGEKYKPIPSLFAPTAFCIPAPSGNPVMVGGPFVPDLAGALINLAASYGFSALLKRVGKKAGKAEKEIAEDLESTAEKDAEKVIDCGDPVNVVTGTVIYRGCDFELPGPLPLKWERNWYSDSRYPGLLGHGCTSVFDTKIKCLPGYIAVLLPDGRAIAFDKAPEDYNRVEKMTLRFHGDHYTLFHHKTRLSYQYAPHPLRENEYRLTAIRNEQGFSINLSYQQARLAYIRDSTGRLLQLMTDERQRITHVQVTERNGKTHPLVAYRYNEAGDLCQVTDALHQSTHIVYERHLMVKKTDRNGQSFYWQYEGKRCIHSWGDHGLLQVKLQYQPGHNTVTDGLGRTTTYHYDARQLITKITDPEGHQRFQEYTGFEERYRITDEEGHVTGFVYDDRGNCTAIQHPDGSKATFQYGAEDRLVMHGDATGNNTLRVYNAAGLPETIIRADNGMTHFAYNEDQLLCAITDNAGQRTTLKYDSSYNLSEIQQPDGSITRWDYDGLGRCIRRVNPAGGVQSLLYDLLGRATRIQQSDGNIIWLQYDAYDDVLKAKDSLHEVTFTYTPLGSLLRRQENNSSLQFHYNPEEELTRIVNEHQETFTFLRNGRGEIISETGFDGSTRRYVRQRNGWISKVERPGGRFTLYEYDGAGRVARTEYSDGGWEIFNYDAAGQLTEATNEQASVYFERDNMGRIIRERSLVTGQEYNVDTTYNRLHQRTSLQSSLGAALSLSYTPAGQVSQLRAQHHHDSAWTADLRYNALGQETERWLPGGIIACFEYDHAGHPLRQRVRSPHRDTRRRQYTWNANERLTGMFNELTLGQVQYHHDDFGQLAFAEYEDGRKQYRNPDPAGNTYRSPQRDDRHYNAGGQLAQANGFSYRYDAEGNLISKTSASGGCWQYTWYGNGRLRGVQRADGFSVIFEYDALGRRMAKIAGDVITRWVWDGNVPLHEWSYPVSGRPVCSLGTLGDLAVSHAEPVEHLVTWVFNEGNFVPAAKLADGAQYSIIADYLGTPVEMYDAGGQQVWDCELDIYGKPRILAKGEAGDCPFRYQGQYEDVETGLYYNRFRYYAPEEGVYLSKDPIGLESGQPNFYSYVSNPNNDLDIFGLVKQGIHGVAPDYETKGLHGTFNGVELSVKPGQNGEISYTQVFSKDSNIGDAVKNANEYFSKKDNVQKALHNLEGSKDYYDKLGKGREWRELKRSLEKKLLCQKS